MTCAGEPLAPAGGCGASVVSVHPQLGGKREPTGVGGSLPRLALPHACQVRESVFSPPCSAGPPQPCQVHPHRGRGGQEPKPTPGKNLELGGDQSFSQAPTKDAACRSGGQRGPWGAAGGSTLGAGLTDSAMPNRVPVPGDDWATHLGQTGQKPKHLHFVWFCPI